MCRHSLFCSGNTVHGLVMATAIELGDFLPLKEVFKSLDLTLELVEKTGRSRAFKLRCRIGWPDTSVCYYNRDFKLKYVRIGAGYAPKYLSDCDDCSDYSAILYAEECEEMTVHICPFRPIYAHGQSKLLDKRMSVQRCVDDSCQRIFLFFYKDKDILDPAVNIREAPLRVPSYVGFRMPRDSDFTRDRNYEFHCMN